MPVSEVTLRMQSQLGLTKSREKRLRTLTAGRQAADGRRQTVENADGGRR
jgi:hypothetical protein